MTDEERIAMYYKFGLLDWRSESKQRLVRKRKPAKRWTLTVEKLLAGILNKLKTILMRITTQ